LFGSAIFKRIPLPPGWQATAKLEEHFLFHRNVEVVFHKKKSREREEKLFEANEIFALAIFFSK